MRIVDVDTITKVKSMQSHEEDIPGSTVLNTTDTAFYRKYFGRVVTGWMITILAFGAYLAWTAVRDSREVEREYFGLDMRTGRMVRMMPLGEPLLAQSVLLQRVQDCVVGVNTYSFANFQREFQSQVECFTDAGWNGFFKSMDEAGTLNAVRTNRLVATATATGVPILVGDAVINGVRTWTIQVPIRVNFQGGVGGRNLAAQEQLVEVVVQRVSEGENRWGHGITQYVAQER